MNFSSTTISYLPYSFSWLDFSDFIENTDSLPTAGTKNTTSFELCGLQRKNQKHTLGALPILPSLRLE